MAYLQVAGNEPTLRAGGSGGIQQAAGTSPAAGAIMNWTNQYS